MKTNMSWTARIRSTTARWTAERRGRVARYERRALRDVAAIVLSATVAMDASADDELPEIPPLPIPYLALERNEKIRTRGGRYFATERGPSRSALVIGGRTVTLDITNADVYVYYTSANGFYAHNLAVGDARDLRIITTAHDAHGIFVDGATLRLERSRINTREVDAHGIYVTGSAGWMSARGGAVQTDAERSSGLRVSSGATLDVSEITLQDGAIAHMGVVTRGESAPGAESLTGAMLTLRGADIETYGAHSPALRVDHASAKLVDTTLHVDSPNGPLVSVENASTLELDATHIEAQARTDPLIELDAGSTLVFGHGSTLRGARAIVVRPTQGEVSDIGVETFPVDGSAGARSSPAAPGASAARQGALITLTDRASIEGEMLIESTQTATIGLRDASLFSGALIGPASVSVASASRWIVNGSTHVTSLENTGTVELSGLSKGRRALAIDGNLNGAVASESLSASPGTIRLYTALNAGGKLAAQETDRVLVSGDVTGVQVLDIEAVGEGGQTDTDGDGEIQATEGISLAQVAGRASENSFVLPPGLLAAGPYQYELKAFAPGQSQASQRLVAGDAGFWDYRIATRKAPDPVVPVVSEEPQDPIQPPEPAAPQDPIQPPVPVENGDPIQAPDPVEPVDPVDSTEPTEPSDASKGGADDVPPVPEPAIKPDPDAESDVPVLSDDPTPGQVDSAFEAAGGDGHAHAHASIPPAGALVEPEVPQDSPYALSYVSMPTVSSSLLRTTLLAWGGPPMREPGSDEGTAMDGPRVALSLFGARAHYRGTLGRPTASPEARVRDGHGYRFDTYERGVQIRFPVFETHDPQGTTRIDAGAVFAQSSMRAMSSASQAPVAHDRAQVRSAGLGVGVTREQVSGFYSRVLVKLDTLELSVRDRAGDVVSAGGAGLGVLGEAGMSFRLPARCVLVPMVTATYVDVRLVDTVDRLGVNVHWGTSRSTAVRLHSRLSRSTEWGGMTFLPYLQTGVTFSGGPPISHAIGAWPYVSAPEGGSWNARVGIKGRIGKHAAIHVDVELDQAVGEGAHTMRADSGLIWSF